MESVCDYVSILSTVVCHQISAQEILSTILLKIILKFTLNTRWVVSRQIKNKILFRKFIVNFKYDEQMCVCVYESARVVMLVCVHECVCVICLLVSVYEWIHQ